LSRFIENPAGTAGYIYPYQKTPPGRSRAFTAVYVGMGTVIAILTGRQYTRELKHPPHRDNEND
jgi:hypothetical protein